jgi:uncharacterized glyoxalase superfamily protein PhnB
MWWRIRPAASEISKTLLCRDAMLDVSIRVESIRHGGGFMSEEMKSTIMPALRYKDAPAAIDWLCNVLGFTKHAVYANPDGTIAHAQLVLGGGMVMLGSAKEDAQALRFKSPEELGGVETGSIYVFAADVDAVHARATAAGAAIVRPLENMDYGSREFAVKDPEGHSWSVGTYDPWKAHA